MSELLLSEQVFLLGHDEESGKNEVSLGLANALAGALTLDLALGELVVVQDKDKVALTGAQADHPLLERAITEIAKEPKPRSLRRWLAVWPARLKPLDQAVGRGLVERGILDERKAKVLGLFSTTRWPERDPEPERRLRARLAEVLLERTEPDADDIALVSLLHDYNMIRGLVDKPDRKQARATAGRLHKQAERGDAVSKAISQTVRATQAAVLASITASTTAANAAVIANAN